MGKDAASSSDGTSNTSRLAGRLVAGFAAFLKSADDIGREAGGLGVAHGTVPGVVARVVTFEDVFDGGGRCSILLACFLSAVLFDALICDVMLTDSFLARFPFSCVGLWGLICSCTALALTSAAFAIVDFCGRGTGADVRPATSAALFAMLAPAVLLRCTTGRFAGGLDGTPNSSSEGRSKTSGLAVAARACAEGRADFAIPSDPAGGALESAECLCGRSGEGAFSSTRLVRGGGRRDSLPYVITFFRLSPVVKVDDAKEVIVDAFSGVVVIQRLFYTGARIVVVRRST